VLYFPFSETTPVGFSDDGPDRVHQLERSLRRGNVKLEESELELLHRLSSVVAVTESDLSELAEFKLSMLDRLSPDYRPPKLKQALSGEALGLLAEDRARNRTHPCASPAVAFLR
jgi:hypothetical protein